MSYDYTKDIHDSWVEVLSPVHDLLLQQYDYLDYLQSQQIEYAPCKRHILRALTMPFNSVKVVILGQDPYPTKGDAVGLSFSVNRERPVPRSLRNIYKELCDDIGVAMPINGDLSPWVAEGVLLLNTSLSVQVGVGNAGTHLNSDFGKNWQIITSHILKAVNDRKIPLVAILWGAHAMKAEKLLTHACVLKSAHPSPLSASRGFFGSKPFSKANAYLCSKGIAPVDWSLESGLF